MEKVGKAFLAILMIGTLVLGFVMIKKCTGTRVHSMKMDTEENKETSKWGKAYLTDTERTELIDKEVVAYAKGSGHNVTNLAKEQAPDFPIRSLMFYSYATSFSFEVSPDMMETTDKKGKTSKTDTYIHIDSASLNFVSERGHVDVEFDSVDEGIFTIVERNIPKCYARGQVKDLGTYLHTRCFTDGWMVVEITFSSYEVTSSRWTYNKKKEAIDTQTIKIAVPVEVVVNNEGRYQIEANYWGVTSYE